MVHKFQFGVGLPSSSKEIYFSQLKRSLELELVLPQYILTQQREEYLIRLLKTNFFLSTDAVYPFMQMKQPVVSNAYFALSLPELLLARGLHKVLALLIIKQPKLNCDFNRMIYACVIGQQGFSSLQVAAELGNSCPPIVTGSISGFGSNGVKQESLQKNYFNTMQESILHNKVVQLLLQIGDQVGCIQIIRKYYNGNNKPLQQKDLKLLEFNDTDGSHHILMKAAVISLLIFNRVQLNTTNS